METGSISDTGCKSLWIGLDSISGVSSTLILFRDIESSLDKLVIDTACDPYPLELADGVFVFGASSESESKVRDVGSRPLLVIFPFLWLG